MVLEREEGERGRGRAAIGVTPRCSQTLPPDNAGNGFMAPGAAPGRPTRIRLPHERPFRLGPAGVCEIDSDASVRPAAAELVLYALHNTLPLMLVPPDRTPHPKRDNPASPWRPYHPRNCSPAHASTTRAHVQAGPLTRGSKRAQTHAQSSLSCLHWRAGMGDEERPLS